MTDHPTVDPDPEVRIRLALEGACEALKLAQREAEGARKDPRRLRWVAAGMVSALQALLVAALSGYDTAMPEAVLDPPQNDRVAPVTLLLRRARSQDYLAPPEKLELTAGRLHAIERIVQMRNASVHGLDATPPETFADDADILLAVIRHLAVEAPAYDRKKFRIQIILLGEACAGLYQELNALRA
ncbi:MAG: hypothetical protein ACK4HR_08120 [Hyphomonas sp.]|jgi:hypothetical protein